MVAKGGHRLLLSEAEAALRDTLLPMAALITPNLPEAEVLAGFPVRNEADMRRAAERLAGLGAKAVLHEGRASRGRHGRRPPAARRPLRALRRSAHQVQAHPRHGLHARLGDRRRPGAEDEPFGRGGAGAQLRAPGHRDRARLRPRPRPAQPRGDGQVALPERAPLARPWSATRSQRRIRS